MKNITVFIPFEAEESTKVDVVRVNDRAGKEVRIEANDLQVSDGFHTLDELYDHRITLWIALCRKLNQFTITRAWRSKVYADGTSFEGWFVMGLYDKAGKQITYHLPIARWAETEFAKTLEKAPEFDGHTPADVLKRLAEL